MKYAFLIRGNFDSSVDKAVIHDGGARIVGVKDLEDACRVAKELCDEGIGCIELCGAFGEYGAKKILEATQNKIPIGYVVNLPEQDELCRQVFSEINKGGI